MEYATALTLIGLAPGTSESELRAAYLELMRLHHPDVSAPSVADGSVTPDAASVDVAAVTEAYAVLQSVLRSSDSTTLPAVSVDLITPRSSKVSPPWVRAERDGSSILIEAPADETYQRLHDAASTLGGIGHVDRGLGLLEVIVRFEGGPSCSVLMSLQGRAHGTEVFLEMESIEAADTPSIDPVIETLLELLTSTY